MKEYDNRRMADVIDNYIHSERDRQVLKRKLIDGISYEKLGEDFRLDDSTVKRIVKRHRETIDAHL